METIADLVAELSLRDHPTLTWYGPEDQRVDLTGKTTANWIIKAANLLTMELACEPGAKVWLDLPVHWRTLVWAHAIWCAGAQVTFTADDADFAVTASPAAAHSHLETVVIALPALARRVENLPPHAVDGAADLMTQGDSFMLPPESDGTAATGLGPSQREVLVADPSLGGGGASPQSSPEAQMRVLLIGDSLPETLSIVPAIWARGASVVIADDEKIGESEGVTHIRRVAGE